MKKSNIIEKQTAFLLAASLLVFTFFIFGPSDLYFGNAQELWFSINDILPITVIEGIIVFTVLNVVYFVTPDKAKTFFTALVWGLGIAVYMQGNFLQIQYGLLDGREIDWGQYTGYGVVNTIFWVVCIISPLILCSIRNNLLKKIITFSSCIIIAVQVVTLVFLGITTNVEKKNFAVTREGIYTLSKNKNIVVFILDAFDAQYMNELLQSDSEFVHQFEGFTYYDNTVGIYPTTKGALPHLLTGIKDLNEMPYDEYLDEAFQKTNFYKILKKNNYVAGIYTFSTFFNIQIPDIIENIVNLAHISIKNPVGFSTKLYRLTASKYFPHVVKRMIWMYSEEFDNYKNASTVKAELYRIDDVYFNQELLANDLEYTSNKNIFRFYHLEGVHPPYVYRRASNENIETISGDETGDRYEQAKAALQIVLNYISRLKKDGVYDKTLMIIMADHGNEHYRQNPLLMIKDLNSAFDFSVSSIPVSYDNIMPMLEACLNDNISSNNFLNNVSLTNDSRYFYHYIWGRANEDQRYLPPIKKVVFDRENNIILNFMEESLDESNVEILYYRYGDTLDFVKLDDNIANEYFIIGFSSKEPDGRWSSGEAGIMRIPLSTLPKSDITVSVEGRLYKPNGLIDHQTVRITANGQFIEEQKLISGTWSFIIPQELVTERKVDLLFEYPDAASPLELGLSTDSRMLAVCYKNMTLSERLGYAFGDTITFSLGGNVDDFITTDLSGKEQWGQWTDGKVGAMSILLSALPKSDITVSVEGRLYKPNGLIDHQTVRITANGQFIEEQKLTSGDWSFVIPKEYVADRNLRLSFEYPDAASPFELGLSKDKRMLAVGYTTMTLTMRKTN
ncbi:MAG: alkaline phosphatase family protein [Syntrophomonadaceae bacterium]|jgi:hypothetical protein|nr:alkaline phosphatase family protein [Syntrophomonadaceae bacterium]